MLTACGGGGDDKSSDDIKGADSGTKSPSASASGSAEVDRPDVSVPKDLKLVFDFDEPSDAKHAAALADAENYVKAMYHGIAAQDPNDPAYQFYSDGQAEQYVKSQIQTWVKGGWAPTGTDQYYDAETTTLTGGKRVLVTFCENQGKAYSKDIKTDKILRTEENADSYLKHRLLMVPSSDSPQVWKVQVIEVIGKAKECRA
ncbi:hypothetical protein CA983_09670 [Streptomyces swartbergensis]|uniref:Uncharacterized protein n=1 Tax=Streptomyces swartbergensis TaxID=487165 RepID=A0A243S743_9ACTN|nr:hypothetical protein CA983_09670 [Streptomyces swartbergensis]